MLVKDLPLNKLMSVHRIVIVQMMFVRFLCVSESDAEGWLVGQSKLGTRSPLKLNSALASHPAPRANFQVSHK
jgi:hypothetical protein